MFVGKKSKKRAADLQDRSQPVMFQPCPALEGHTFIALIFAENHHWNDCCLLLGKVTQLCSLHVLLFKHLHHLSLLDLPLHLYLCWIAAVVCCWQWTSGEMQPIPTSVNKHRHVLTCAFRMHKGWYSMFGISAELHHLLNSMNQSDSRHCFVAKLNEWA